MVKVSVIMPVYNSEKFLTDCLESLVVQTLDNVEIICIDDASTDGSSNVIAKYQNNYANIDYIKLDQNHGQAFARNRGIERANGKYVYFIDSDDFLCNKNSLAVMYDSLEATEAECLCFDSEIIYESDELKPMLGNRNKLYESLNGGTFEGKKYFCNFFLSPEYSVGVWRQFWRKDFLVKNKLFFSEDTSPHEDLLFTFESFYLAKDISYLPEVLHTYRFRKKSSSSDNFSLKRLRAYQRIYLESMHFLAKNAHDTLSVNMQKAISTYLSASLMPLYGNYADLSARGFDILQLNTAKTFDDWYGNFLLMQRYPMLERIFDADEIRKIKEAKKLIIYGAGVYSKQLQQMLHDFNVYDYCVSVTDNKDKEEYPTISEFASEAHSCLVIIAVSSLWRNEMRKNIEKLGFENIVELY